MITLPTIITLMRLVLVPVTIWAMLRFDYGLAFWLFAIAGLTDAVDGFLARHLHQISRLGAFLDPLADKSLVLSVFIILGHQDHISAWLLILIIFREIVIVGGAILYQIMTLRLTVTPLWISKLNTTCQIALAGLILAELALNRSWGNVRDYLIWLTALTTLLSGMAYVAIWGARLAREEDY